MLAISSLIHIEWWLHATWKKSLIPSTCWRNSNDHRHTFKGSIWSPLQALVLDQHSENQNILENHFGLQETFRRTMNGSSQRKFRELYSSPKPVMKMNLYNSFTAWINIPNQYKKEEELWNWRHSIQIGVWHFNKEKLLSITKLIMSYTKISSRLQVRGKGVQSLILYDNQTSKSGKLNGVGKIFPDLF